MSYRNAGIRQGVLLLTTLAIYAGLFLSSDLFGNGLLIFSILLILGGIPHGAADALLFQKMFRKQSRFHFFFSYFVVLVGYGLVWYYWPLLAFIAFLLVSFYHFGQSNWNYLQETDAWEERGINLLWGSFVVLFPVLIHHEEAAAIVFDITGSDLSGIGPYRAPILFLLLFANLLVPVTLNQRSVLSRKNMRKEIGNIVILTLLFISTPLMLGFAVYFVIWHSLSSVLDQTQLLQMGTGKTGVRRFLTRLIPLSVVAYAGLFGFVWWGGYFAGAEVPVGKIFLFISLITLPHAILVEGVYQSGSDGGAIDSDIQTSNIN